MKFRHLLLLNAAFLCGVLPAWASADDPSLTLGGKFVVSGTEQDLILNGGTFPLTAAESGTSAKTIAGSSRIILNNGSILRLGHGATYSIPNYIQVNRGVIESTSGDPHFTGHVTIGPGGATLITHTGDISFEADLTGDGPLNINGAVGIVRFNNDFSFMGAVRVNSGRIFLGDKDALNQATLVAGAGMRGIDFAPEVKPFSLGALTGDADIDLKGKKLRVGVSNTDFVYAGNFADSAGGGGLIKSGSGTMTLTGVHPPAVAMSVHFGALVIDGKVGGEIKIGDPRIPLTRAVLMGTGTTGNILLETPGARVQPGSPGNIGVLTVRNFSMIPGSILSIRIGGPKPGRNGYDQVRASGQFSLYGNLEIALPPGFKPRPGDAFYIMTTSATAPVLGRFGNIMATEITASGSHFRINYSADSARNDPASTKGHDVALIALP